MRRGFAHARERWASGRKLVWCLLLGVLLALLPGVGLPGCRKAKPPGQDSSGTQGDVQGNTQEGGGAEPLRVVVSDQRRLYPRTGYDAFETGAYLDTKVSPGQEVLIGQGDFSIDLYWAPRVGGTGCRSGPSGAPCRSSTGRASSRSRRSE